MACCAITAYLISRIIQACETFDIKLLDIQYNDNDFEGRSSRLEAGQAKRSDFVSTRFLLDGMTCGACVGTIEKAVSSLDGVDRISVALPLARATVVHDQTKCSPEEIILKIEELGYGARLGERTAEQNLQLLQQVEELSVLRRSFNGAATLSSLVAGIEQARAFCPRFNSGWRWLNEILHVFSLLIACWIQIHDVSWIHKSAWTRGKKGLFTMDTLISLSLLLGLALSSFNITLHGLRNGQTYFSSGSFLATVITAGRYLDTLLKRKSAENFCALYRLQAEAAQVRLSRSGVFIDAALLRVQDEIVIERHAIIPCDCYVTEGASTVDQSTMTGEPVPVPKATGDFLLAGTRNISRPLTVIVAKEQKDSSLENLIDTIGAATEQKLDVQQTVESMITYFVSSVLLLTVFACLWTFQHANSALSRAERVQIACERGMAILAASCPCAFGLAAPSAVMAGIDAAWVRGAILTGGARTIESLSKLTHIVMDKTGTLTTGQLRVSSHHLDPNNRSREASSYRLLSAAEREEAQSHPVGNAVFQWALNQMDSQGKRRQSTLTVRNRYSLPGKGISCEVEGDHGVWYTVHVGSQRFLQNCGISIPQPKESTQTGTTAVHFAFNEKYAGTLVLQDTIRPEAPAIINELKKRGLTVTMLTGDTAEEAHRVSKELRIDVLASKSLPHEKKALVESWQSRGHIVAMVGDGINDAPAQAAADVGIQLSHARTCVTGAAEIIIVSPDLSCVPQLLHIASETMRQARRNLQWALGYNTVAISLAMGAGERWGVTVTASTAGTMMAFSSISVLAMSLLLRRRLR